MNKNETTIKVLATTKKNLKYFHFYYPPTILCMQKNFIKKSKQVFIFSSFVQNSFQLNFHLSISFIWSHICIFLYCSLYQTDLVFYLKNQIKLLMHFLHACIHEYSSIIRIWKKKVCKRKNKLLIRGRKK